MSQARETHLPAYEPPILPLTGTTTDALTRPVRNVESAARFITDSLTLLSAAAAELGEISTESSGSRAYNTDTDERKAERAELLEKIEAAVRAACDAAAKLEFQEAVVEEIQKREHPQSRAADAKRRQRMVRIQRGEEDDEEDEDEDDGTGEKSCKVEESVWHRYKTGYQKEVDEYVGLTDKEKSDSLRCALLSPAVARNIILMYDYLRQIRPQNRVSTIPPAPLRSPVSGQARSARRPLVPRSRRRRRRRFRRRN